MEKVRPWCGQPSDQGWLMNRTDDHCHLHTSVIVTVVPVVIVAHLMIFILLEVVYDF